MPPSLARERGLHGDSSDVDWQHIDVAVRHALQTLELDYLAELRAWEEIDGQMTGARDSAQDRYERRSLDFALPRARRARAVKSTINGLVALAGASAAQRSNLEVCGARALVLDGVEGRTLSALSAEGFRRENIFTPNIVPEVAWALRRQGASAWAGRVEDFLASPLLRRFQLVYLDYTGSFPPRAGQVRSLFERGLVASGSALALTFSCREGPWGNCDPCSGAMPAGWSQAHAVYAAVHVLLSSAAACGLALKGGDLDGLDDYDYHFSSGGCCRSSDSGTKVASRAATGVATIDAAGVAIGAASGLVHIINSHAAIVSLPSYAVDSGSAAIVSADVLCGGAAAGEFSSLDALRSMRSAMDLDDLAGLATAVATWAATSRPPEAGSGRAAWLRQNASHTAGQVLAAIGGSDGAHVCGAAWRSGNRRGSPHAVLGSAGAVHDAQVKKLRSISGELLREFSPVKCGGSDGVAIACGAATSCRSGDGVTVFVCDTDADGHSSTGVILPDGTEFPCGRNVGRTTLEKCVVLYPEMMMFLVVKVCQA